MFTMNFDFIFPALNNSNDQGITIGNHLVKWVTSFFTNVPNVRRFAKKELFPKLGKSCPESFVLDANVQGEQELITIFSHDTQSYTQPQK